MKLIYVISSERVDGNLTDGWDNVVLRIHVVCKPYLRTPCISPQRQPLGEPIAHRGGQALLRFRPGCLSFTSSLGERPAVHAVLSAAEAEAEFPAVAALAGAARTSSPSLPGRCHVACLLDRSRPLTAARGHRSCTCCRTSGESSF